MPVPPDRDHGLPPTLRHLPPALGRRRPVVRAVPLGAQAGARYDGVGGLAAAPAPAPPARLAAGHVAPRPPWPSPARKPSNPRDRAFRRPVAATLVLLAAVAGVALAITQLREPVEALAPRYAVTEGQGVTDPISAAKVLPVPGGGRRSGRGGCRHRSAITCRSSMPPSRGGAAGAAPGAASSRRTRERRPRRPPRRRPPRRRAWLPSDLSHGGAAAARAARRSPCSPRRRPRVHRRTAGSGSRMRWRVARTTSSRAASASSRCASSTAKGPGDASRPVRRRSNATTGTDRAPCGG